MINRLRDYIKQEKLFESNDKILLAVSGGVDSVVLSELMYRIGAHFDIAHCNFHLRPGDCDRDESFVKSLSQKLGKDCYVRGFDTMQFAKDHKLSVEDAARKLRYDFFEEISQSYGYKYIATAHHRDDSTETFFLNLLRGTGISGLHGILPKNGNVIRPLLPFSRKEIEQFAEENRIDYVTDSTNSSLKYKRNQVRLRLMPLLREISPAIDDVMVGNINRLREVEQVYKKSVKATTEALVRKENYGYSVRIEDVKGLCPRRTLLFEILKQFDCSSTLVDELLANLDSSSGKKFYTPTHRIVKDRDVLMISPLEEKDDCPRVIADVETLVSDPICLRFSKEDSVESFKSPKEIALMDLDKVHFPLKLRHWRDGDRFTPFGMKGSKLLSDYFSDNHFSIVKKEQQWILCDNNDEIIWIVGERMSESVRITPSTSQILIIQYLK